MKTINILMRAFFCTYLGGFLFLSVLNAQPRPPQGPRPPVIVSPEISGDMVTFRLYSKEATAVSLSGDWIPRGESEALVKNDSGIWSVEVGPLEPEFYNYYFTVDGVRAIDPANPHTVRDGNRYASSFLMPGDESELYEVNNVPHGNLTKVWYQSPLLGMQRRMYVYTPAGYPESSESYPVLYLLHGGGGDEDAWSTMGRACYIMDNLIASGKAIPMIVVMTNGNPGQTAAVTDRKAVPEARGPMDMGANDFPNSLVKDVIPYIEGHYRVLTGNENRAIAGLSMGALQTQITSINNPALFQYIGVFSIGLQMEFGETTTELIKAYDSNLSKLEQNGYKLFYIGCGEDDFVYEGVTLLRKKLDEHNFKYVYRETTGGHTWANWRIYLSDFAPRLFR